MINFFLNELRVNVDTVSVLDPQVTTALDNASLSGYDAQAIARNLLNDHSNVSKALLTTFYNRLFLAYLIHDTGFDNTSWGVHLGDELKPMEYIPKTPFAPKDTYLKYKWGALTMSPDWMSIVAKNYIYALEVCKVLVQWYKERTDMILKYCKINGMRNVSLWGQLYHDIDSRAYDAYISILTLLYNDNDFLQWLSELPRTEAVSDFLENGISDVQLNIKNSVDYLGYCLTYLRDVVL